MYSADGHSKHTRVRDILRKGFRFPNKRLATFLAVSNSWERGKRNLAYPSCEIEWTAVRTTVHCPTGWCCSDIGFTDIQVVSSKRLERILQESHFYVNLFSGEKSRCKIDFKFAYVRNSFFFIVNENYFNNIQGDNWY